MRNVLLLLLILSTSSARSQTHSAKAFCGGEGVTPWSESAFSGKGRRIPTRGKEIRDFLFWEGKNALVYRNEKHELYAHDLKTNEPRYLSQLHQPLSRITDPQERYLLTERKSYILDARSSAPAWYQFGAFEPVYQHMFWNFRDLYSLASNSQAEMKHKINVNLYRPGQLKPVTCTLEAGPGEELHFAEGHEFPMLYLYKTAPAEVPGMTRLTLINLRVGPNMAGLRCQTDEHAFRHPIMGNVTEVHFFSHTRRAIRTDHPTHSLMWWNGELDQCKYVGLGKKQIIVPNHSRHVLFTFEAEEGLRMYFPGETDPVELPVLQSSSIANPSDIWLNSYGNRLFVPMVSDGYDSGNILELTLKGDSFPR